MARGLILSVVLVALLGCGAPTQAPPLGPGQAAAAAPDGGAAPSAGVVGPLRPAARVKGGLTNTLGDAGVFMAIDRGYFAAEGLELEITRVAGAAQAVPQLATDQLDTAGISPSAGFFNAVSRGLPLRIAGDKAHQAVEGNSAFWVLRPDIAASGVVRDWADLRGMTLGVNLVNTGTVSDIQLDQMLDRAGLTRDDVTVLDISYADVNAALANHTIDAAYHTEPFVTVGENQGVLHRWRPGTDVMPTYYTTVWIYSPAFAETEAASRFMVAFVRGARDYNDAFVHGRGKAAAVETLMRHTAVKDPALYERMGFTSIDPDGRVLQERVEADARYYLARGFSQQAIDVSQVIDTRFTDYAVSRLGPYRPPAP
jgi:NitT/TauT family transport system substrate-binding protein